MTATGNMEIYLVAVPGLEAALCAEAKALGFKQPKVVPGGVTLRGGWPEVWRANLEIRGASKVLARIGNFRVMHLAQLDKRARKFPWNTVLRADVPLRVEASCKSSRIYHAGAATQRIETAIREELGALIDPGALLCVKARIEDDLCTISIDTSGEMLHKRGNKQEIGKAPMRETMASLFLRQCGFDGTEPVVDPMCGSGTFVIEAAEMAMGLKPGRSRSFAFEQLAGFDAAAWVRMRDGGQTKTPAVTLLRQRPRCRRDSHVHAPMRSAPVLRRYGVSQAPISELTPPDGPPGLVIINPPYGSRIGDKKPLFGLYGALGKTLLARFGGWRIGLITTDASLAKATGLPFAPRGEPVLHGGLRVSLFQTGPLG